MNIEHLRSCECKVCQHQRKAYDVVFWSIVKWHGALIVVALLGKVMTP